MMHKSLILLLVLIIMLCAGCGTTVSEPETTVVIDLGNFNTIPETTMPTADTITTEQIRAMNAAFFYLDNTWFSHDGLVEQLEIDEYSHEAAMYAASHCGADWMQQTLTAASSYLDYGAFSYKGMIHQLEECRFTHEQAVYGADNCGADWVAEAIRAAEAFLLNCNDISRDQLLVELVYAGFTEAQAEYAADQVGI